MNLLHASCDTCDFGWAGPAFKDFVLREGKLVQLGFRVGKSVDQVDVFRFLPKLCSNCGEVTFVYENSPNNELLPHIGAAEVENASMENRCSACGNTAVREIVISGLFLHRQECPKCEGGRLRVKRSIAV